MCLLILYGGLGVRRKVKKENVMNKNESGRAQGEELKSDVNAETTEDVSDLNAE